jgi:hypothetical protein
MGRGEFMSRMALVGPAAKELRNCRPGREKVVAKPARPCSAEEKILGLCK